MSGLLIVANKLNGSAALKAKVPVQRQFMVVAQQAAAMPFIVMSQVSGDDFAILSGQGEYPRERIQVDVVAATYTAAKEISDLVRESLINTIKATISAVGVKDVDIIGSGMEITDFSDDRSAVVIASDFRVRWRRQ